MGNIRVLYIGEIVSSPGVYCVKALLPKIKEEQKIDFIIANGEGATGGFGLGKNHSIYLRKLGIDVITGGECIYYKKDMVGYIEKASFILRPANYPYDNPGRGWKVYIAGERKIGVISLLGQYGFNRVYPENPYKAAAKLIEKISKETNTIIIDYHAVATAEKITMSYIVNGKVSALIGSHTKVPTADERILPGGTAVITDAGRTGPVNSVGGLDPDIEINKFLTQIPELSRSKWGKLELQGVVIEIDEKGKAQDIQRIKYQCVKEQEVTFV